MGLKSQPQRPLPSFHHIRVVNARSPYMPSQPFAVTGKYGQGCARPSTEFLIPILHKAPRNVLSLLLLLCPTPAPSPALLPAGAGVSAHSGPPLPSSIAQAPTPALSALGSSSLHRTGRACLETTLGGSLCPRLASAKVSRA